MTWTTLYHNILLVFDINRCSPYTNYSDFLQKYVLQPAAAVCLCLYTHKEYINWIVLNDIRHLVSGNYTSKCKHYMCGQCEYFCLNHCLVINRTRLSCGLFIWFSFEYNVNNRSNRLFSVYIPTLRPSIHIISLHYKNWPK